MQNTTQEEHKLELATALLNSGRNIRIKALGTRMLPTIWPSDILLIESTLYDELIRGDVVLVKRENSILIHRLVKRSGLQWITRGDAMPQDDPPVASVAVLGRVSEIQRRRRVVVPKRRILPLQRVLAWVLCHSRICRTVALLAHSARDRSSQQIGEIPLAHGSPQTN